MKLSNKAVFFVSAVVAVGGALLSLDWSQVASPQTVGVITTLIGGGIAFARVLLSSNTDNKSE